MEEQIFTDEQFDKMLTHFKNKEFSQFNLIIINKALDVKQYTVKRDEILTFFVGVLSNVVEKLDNKVNLLDSNGFKQFANALYLLLLSIDVKEIYNNPF